MATSHYCNGKWRDGTVAECPKHKGLSKKQTSVYRSPDKDQAASTSDSSSSDSSSSDSSSSDSSSGDSSSASGDSGGSGSGSD